MYVHIYVLCIVNINRNFYTHFCNDHDMQFVDLDCPFYMPVSLADIRYCKFGRQFHIRDLKAYRIQRPIVSCK